MKHQALDELRLKAQIVNSDQVVNAHDAGVEPARLSRAERIERWATLLDRHGGPLVAFVRVETYPRRERRALRDDNTPVSLAFSDPVLRDDGLAGDTFGDAMSYFEMSEGEAHRLLCDCRYRGSMTGPTVAERLRAAAKGGFFYRLTSWLF